MNHIDNREYFYLDYGEYLYFDNGNYHISDKNGNEFWYNSNGEYHRENGAAVTYNNIKKQHYYQHGKRHRLDGPAIKTPKYESWYIEGIQYSKEEFLRIVKMKYLL
jgi:hypothetical protein